ncbi:tetratricopeptide repeat protein [Glaciecola sp. 1036]|uniref:tetratricopeptide repeat protein n=1 Tax=Alteromonadaceae TaxID=72275 RepID=UPI003CFBD68C
MFKTFLSELRRRNVLPTILPYMALVWLLLQVVIVIQPMFNLHPLVNTFSAVILIASLPVVIYLSWFFDITLAGIAPVKKPDGQSDVQFGKSKWLILSLIIAISGYFGYLYFEQVRTELEKSEAGLSQIKSADSIAVIPFSDQSAEQEQGFLSIGLTEELTNLLGKVSQLKVAASSATITLYEKNLPPTDIGRRLGVDAVVTGSVRVTGNKLNIRAELLDTQSGKTIWSENFNRQFKDIFAIEEEIARAIANLLQDRFVARQDVDSDSKTASTDAYVFYLKGREEYRKQTTESMKAARKYYEQAIGLDPEYAQAYVGLADTLAMLAKETQGFGHDAFFSVLDRDIASRLSMQNLEKALTREPDLAEAYAVQGLVLALLQDKDQEALESLDKATSLNPSLAKAYMWKFAIYDSIGQYGEAWEELQTAYKIDPVSIANQYNLGFYQLQNGDIEQAQEQFTQLINEFPNSPFGYAGLASLNYFSGDLSETAKMWWQAHKQSPENEAFQRNYIQTLIEVGVNDESFSSVLLEDYTTSFLIIDKEYQALFERMELEKATYPNDPWLLFESGWYYLLFGEEELGKQDLLAAKDLLEEQDLFEMPFCSPAIEFAWVFKQEDNLEEFNRLTQRCNTLYLEAVESGVNDPYLEYLGARLNVLRGDETTAATLFTSAIENGWLQWWTKHDPLLQDVVGNASFANSLSKMEQELANEKQQVEKFLKQKNM